MNKPLKVYTKEDNIKSIFFSVKQMEKDIAQMNSTLLAILQYVEKIGGKDDDTVELPF